jgi:hypothetical protein
MSQVFDITLPVKARDNKEAAGIQQALHSISGQFTANQLAAIARQLRNPLVKAAILQKLGL